VTKLEAVATMTIAGIEDVAAAATETGALAEARMSLA